MAYNIIIGLYVNTSATGVSAISGPTWSNMKPTYWTYPGNTTNRSFGGTGFTQIDTLYTTSSRGQNKYVLYLVDAQASGFDVGHIGTLWLHNDTSSYAHPESPDVNVNNGKYVWVYDNEAPPSYNYNGTSLPVFTFDCRFNMWQPSPDTLWDREFRSKFTTAVATLDYPDNGTGSGLFNGPGLSYGTSIVELYDTAPTSDTKLLLTNNTSITTSSSGVYNQYCIYDHVSSSYTKSSSPAQTSTTYPRRIYVIHDGVGALERYRVGYIGNNSAVTVYYKSITGNTNLWVSLTDVFHFNYLYLATTVSTTGKFIEYVLPVQLGKQYEFIARSRAASNNGIIISKTQITNPSGTANLNNIGTSSDRITYASGATTVSATYKPTADGNVYIYYRTKSSDGLGTTGTANCAMGSVQVHDTELDFINVTFDKNGGSGGTNSQLILPGTAAADYPSITLPTRSGYIFQGYFDDQTGGTAYYNAAGQGTKVFDKVDAVTLYAHWQQESLPTKTVTLNDNGGYGGQGTANVVSGQMIGTVTVPSRDGFKFLGYYNKYNTAPGGSGQYQYVDDTGTGCKTISSNITLYALWENSISYDLLYSVQNPKVVTYSSSSQTITVSEGGWSCAGGTMSNIQYTIEGGGTVSSSNSGMSFSIPSKDVATYTLSVTLTSSTSAAANGYFGTTKTYSFGVRYIQKNIEFHLLGQEVYSPDTAQAKVKAEVAGTLYWGTSSSSMTSMQSVTAGLSNWASITSATQTSVGTKTIYGYFVPSSINYNWVGGVGNPGDSAVLTVLQPVSQTVTITLNDNGGSGGSGSIVVQSGSSNSNWPNVGVPTRAGFTFMGYFTVSTATGGSQVYQSSGSPYYGYSTSSNVTIYARWQINISYTHNNVSTESATVKFVSDQPGEATSTSSPVTFQINGGQITCLASSWTISITDSGKESWTINSTGTTFTVPSGTSYTYSPTYFRWQIVVADGTYNNYPYVGNTIKSGYTWETDTPRPIYYNLKRVEYVKDGSYNAKYKDMNGTPGYNVTNAPKPGTGNYIYGPYYNAYTTAEGYRYISNSITNDISWYQKYTNGTWDTTLKTGTTGVYGVWRIISETFTPAGGGTVQNITRSHATDTAVASQLLIGGNYYTVYSANSLDECFCHDSMEDNLGTDNLVVRIYNPSDPSQYTDITRSVTNSLSDTKYADASGSTQGYASMSYAVPYLSIVPNPSGRETPFLASDTRASVYCSAENYATWYQKCSSSVYVFLSGTVITSARWRILSQNCVGGTDRFSTYLATSSSITVGGSSYTVYNNGNNISHATMGTNVGDDTVAVIAYNLEDLSKTTTSSVTVTNGYTDTSTGVSSYGTPTLTLTKNLTASNGNVIVNCSVTNSIRFRRDYDSGSSSTFASAVPGVARWAISSNGSNRFSPSGTGTTFSGLTVYNDGDSIAHSTMGTWVGTDTVVVKAYNMLSTKTTPSASASASVKNSIVSSGQPTIVSYGTPTVTIGTGISAGGGSATVTCNVSNTQRVVNTYTTGATSNVDSLVAGTAKWMITSQSGGRCSPSGTSSVVGSSTMYNSGGTVQHSTMGSNVGTDSVTVTAYNVSSTAKKATATASTSNAYESLKISGAANSISFGASTSGSVYASFTSGLEVDVTDSIAVNAASGNRITSSNTNIITIS